MTKSHAYHCTKCPECQSNLTAEYSIVIIFNPNAPKDERQNAEIVTRLDENGVLIDVENVIANGWHVDTECRNCGESLANEERFDS